MSSEMVQSFDVFDTAISRKYATPEDVHWHLGEILTIQKLVRNPEEFYVARQHAERSAWQVSNYRKAINIWQIYSIIAARLNWPDDEARKAMKEEVRLEYEAAMPVLDLLTTIKAARAAGHRVCFISDMHLLTEHIEKMLGKLTILQPEELVFVSSDVGQTKRSGRMFKEVLQKLNIPPKALLHTGDHKVADVESPRKLGIKTKPYLRAILNRHEEYLARQPVGNKWRERSLAVVSKLSRLEFPAGRADSKLAELICSTVAPFITAYASWLLSQASKRGIKKLFFLARDMEIVHSVAAELARAKGSEVECIYLHASRKAWQAPSYEGASAFDLSWLLDHLRDGGIEEVLARLLPPGDVKLIKAEMPHVFSGGSGAHLSKQNVCALLQTEPLASHIKRTAQARRNLLLKYLDSMRFVPDDSCALVDAGWRGTLQKCLVKCYKMNGVTPKINAFYIGLSISNHDTEQWQGTFLPHEIVHQYGYSLCALLESFLTAKHGSTSGYEESSERVVPLLAPSPSKALIDQWQLTYECCAVYVKHFHASHAFELKLDSIADRLKLPFLNLFSQPTYEDAILLRDWVFDAGRDGQHIKKIASPIDVKNFGKLLIYKKSGVSLSQTYLSSPWTQGCLAITSTPVRALSRLLLAKN